MAIPPNQENEIVDHLEMSVIREFKGSRVKRKARISQGLFVFCFFCGYCDQMEKNLLRAPNCSLFNYIGQINSGGGYIHM